MIEGFKKKTVKEKHLESWLFQLDTNEDILLEVDCNDVKHHLFLKNSKALVFNPQLICKNLCVGYEGKKVLSICCVLEVIDKINDCHSELGCLLEKDNIDKYYNNAINIINIIRGKEYEC